MKLFDDYFEEYKRLGGKKTKKQYIKNLGIFFAETFHIFVEGSQEIHETREDAVYTVMEIANISVDEYNLIFESVDNITAYT